MKFKEKFVVSIGTDIISQKDIEKLLALKVKIAYPDKWRDYSALNIQGVEEGGSYLQNLLNARAWNHNENLEDLGNPVDKTRWGMAPQIVNAYFRPSFNEIVFPAAILQPPFYNYEADDAVNYGGIGAGIGQPRIWFIGAEYTSQKTSNFSNELFDNSNTTQTFEDASGFSLGGFYIPKYNSFTSYLKRVVYRAGVRFENTGLKINDESINEFGMSFGVGLPIGNLFSNANIGFEIGKRGTVDNNLIQENFINFQISLSLNDRWFNKRKYN